MERTPIFWNLINEYPFYLLPFCGLIGPQVGIEDPPLCKLLPDHGNIHEADPFDGLGIVTWRRPF